MTFLQSEQKTRFQPVWTIQTIVDGLDDSVTARAQIDVGTHAPATFALTWRPIESREVVNLKNG